jgi:hypothetical protein
LTGNEQLDIKNEIIIKWYNLGKTVENRCFQKDSKSYKIKKQYFNSAHYLEILTNQG